MGAGCGAKATPEHVLLRDDPCHSPAPHLTVPPPLPSPLFPPPDAQGLPPLSLQALFARCMAREEKALTYVAARLKRQLQADPQAQQWCKAVLRHSLIRAHTQVSPSQTA